MGRSDEDTPQEPQTPQEQTQTSKSGKPDPSGPGEDALAVDALPDETRLHGDADETEMDQSTAGYPTPDESSTDEPADAQTER